MPPRALKLGTRRSALARAQSAAVARQLEQLHPGLAIELVGIETRGDRSVDPPGLSPRLILGECDDRVERAVCGADPLEVRLEYLRGRDAAVAYLFCDGPG